TWKNTPGQYPMSVRYKNGIIYGFDGDSATGGHIITSSDFGLTWQQSKAGIDFDSWSFAIDSCDPNRIYLSHENAVTQTDPFSKIFLSTDRGDTWQTIVSHPEPFFCGSVAEGNSAIYCQTVAQGVFRSTDRGMTWRSIRGPSVTFDTRLIAAINDNILLAVDNNGNVWRTYNSGGDSVIAPQSLPAKTLFIPSQPSILNQSLCNTPVDTSIPLDIVGCGTLTGTLDSLWLTGSSAFQLADSLTAPRTLGIVDSILVSYDGTPGSDTSTLHLRFDLGSGQHDTTIQLIGNSPTPSTIMDSAQLHRESASAYDGQFDSLTLGVDISSAVNLDSLWPYITDIQATYSWDSSVVRYVSYLPPIGWTVSSVNSQGNEADISIHKISSSPSNPLILGTAIFLPNQNQPATSWIRLPRFIMDAGCETVSIIATDNEDSHWAVMTLGVQSGVAQVPNTPQDISIYPNPASNEIDVRFQNALSGPASYRLIDALGKTRLSGITQTNQLSLDASLLPAGIYFFRAETGDGFSLVRQVVVEH
ncbi:MAG: T9SS type A sorting domain-containing protein, partial [Candidatus Kapaibacterium sp.]